MDPHTPSFLFDALTLPGETYNFRQYNARNEYCCVLCNEVTCNERGFKHMERVEALKRYQDTVRDAAERHHRVLALGDEFTTELGQHLVYPVWRDAVQASLYRYLMATNDPDHTLLNYPVKTFQTYKFLKKLALLELAVWKAKCQSEMPLGMDFIAVQTWISTGWKSHKEEQRKSNSTAIIVKGVMPFLDAPGTE